MFLHALQESQEASLKHLRLAVELQEEQLKLQKAVLRLQELPLLKCVPWCSIISRGNIKSVPMHS